MDAFFVHGMIAIWWSIAVLILCANEDQFQLKRDLVGTAVFWPIVAVLALFVILWRIPFKSARTIRNDLRNRNLLRAFNEWVAHQELDESAIGSEWQPSPRKCSNPASKPPPKPKR
ncbi:MAG: hypothetical protein CSA70_03625 [Rhodobacterales bacterium]|nr:MAG: hypothetical protein CSA70_03625 [Rhodobacterales bacterium]